MALLAISRKSHDALHNDQGMKATFMCSPKEVYLRGFTLLGKWLMVWYHNTNGVLRKKPTCLRVSSECRNPLVVSHFGTILIIN